MLLSAFYISYELIRSQGEKHEEYKRSMNTHTQQHQLHAALIQKAEEWAERLYHTRATGFLNQNMSNPQTGRYVVDLMLEELDNWISIEIQVKHGAIYIPGGALITGRSSLSDIHRRFN